VFPELTEGPLASVDAERARARDAEDQKRWSDAALSWSRILRSHPEDVEAHLGYARALVKTGRIGTGLEEFAEAARLAPENADVYLRWANAAVEAGEWDEAARLYAQARSLAPSNLKVLNNLAALELTRGAYGESVSLLRQVVEAEPGFAPAHLNLALALEGEGAPAGQVIEPLETYLRLGGARSAEAEQWLVRLRGMQAAP
jgi:Flp pilus assembly protein TadD